MTTKKNNKLKHQENKKKMSNGIQESTGYTLNYIRLNNLRKKYLAVVNYTTTLCSIDSPILVHS